MEELINALNRARVPRGQRLVARESRARPVCSKQDPVRNGALFHPGVLNAEPLSTQSDSETSLGGTLKKIKRVNLVRNTEPNAWVGCCDAEHINTWRWKNASSCRCAWVEARVCVRSRRCWIGRRAR